MVTTIIAIIGLVLTSIIYLFGGWRFLRYPRFWVTSAQADVETTSDNPPIWMIQNVSVSVAYRGGGQPRNIIDIGFVMYESRDSLSGAQSTSGWLEEVIHVPSELGGRFALEVSGKQVVETFDVEDDELHCSLRLDCGGESFEAPFTLKGPGETWLYERSSFESPISLARIPRKGLRRLFDRIRSR